LYLDPGSKHALRGIKVNITHISIQLYLEVNRSEREESAILQTENISQRTLRLETREKPRSAGIEVPAFITLGLCQ
jgi:sporulation-control protein spo0M